MTPFAQKPAYQKAAKYVGKGIGFSSASQSYMATNLGTSYGTADRTLIWSTAFTVNTLNRNQPIAVIMDSDFNSARYQLWISAANQLYFLTNNGSATYTISGLTLATNTIYEVAVLLPTATDASTVILLVNGQVFSVATGNLTVSSGSNGSYSTFRLIRIATNQDATAFGDITLYSCRVWLFSTNQVTQSGSISRLQKLQNGGLGADPQIVPGMYANCLFDLIANSEKFASTSTIIARSGQTCSLTRLGYTANYNDLSRLWFDNTDDLANAPVNSPQPTGTFTVEAIVTPGKTISLVGESTPGTSGSAGVGTTQAFMLTPVLNTANVSTQAAFGVSVGTNGVTVMVNRSNYFGKTYSLLTYTATISANTHIAVVFENRQPKLYVNGVLVRTGLQDGFTPTIAQIQAGGGSLPNFLSGQLNGYLKNLRIWTVARTQIEIDTNKTVHLSSGSGLYASYSFTRTTATQSTIADDSGNGRNMTMQNFTLTGYVPPEGNQPLRNGATIIG